MKPPFIFTLCCLNMISAGTLYMFSLYGPQFAEKLHYTQTETSFIAVTGDYGMYLSGPLCGWAVDFLGPQNGCFLGAVFLAFGYIMMALTYNQVLFSDSFVFMAIYLAVAGMGSTFSYMSTISILAKNFKKNRGVALGIPIAMYGLSAFIWTTTSRVIFMRSDDTLNIYGFLLFLGVATCIINLNSAVGFGQLPLGDGEIGKGKAKDTQPVPPTAAASLASGSQVPPQQNKQRSRAPTPTEVTPLLVEEEEEVLVQEDLVVAVGNGYEEPDVSGFAFFKDPEVWAFLISLICLSGGGLMIINSIGAIIGSLYDNTTSPDSPLRLLIAAAGQTPLASLQSTHVSLISISSCIGRISAGITSDFLKSRHISRLWCYLGFGAIMLASQCLGAFFVDRLDTIPYLTVLTGVAYGGAFSVSPTITAEFWGTRRFASNWGWVSWAPALGGLMCNLVFGVYFDEEAQRQKESSRPGVFVQCQGVDCFRRSFIFTVGACSVGLAIAVSLSISRRRRKAAIKRERLAKLGIYHER